ncbi:hypothetical protein JQX13_11860 [Archangium violaceum]|uniref:hypothetical protein n=1 Tax=Archangium violaceum TaxID=83451 RepID=UPI00193C4CEB|nr:hypothetical protein [Archangium violaceum]QRK10704.1 hypothetical protein JQX13_11860 [Archangium violaceum]
MADKQKEGTGKAKRTVVRRRRTTGGAAGRIAVRRDAAPYRSAAADEHSVQVREHIEAALVEARRMREDIEQRIDRRLQEEDTATPGQVITRLSATTGPRTVRPLSSELRARSEDRSRPKTSK